MKKCVTLLFFILVVVSSSAYADVFASAIRITNPNGSKFDGVFTDGSGVKISYILNDTATNVVVNIYDAGTNAVVGTINGGAQSSGENSVLWDGSGAVNGKKYYVGISATQKTYSKTDYTIFKWIATGEKIGNPGRGIYTRGTDAMRNMDRWNFGYIYGSNSDFTNNTSYLTGILRFTADWEFAGTDSGHPILSSSLAIENGGTFDYSSLSPWNVTLDQKGKIYFSGNPATSGPGKVYMMKNDTTAPTVIIDSLIDPRGLCIKNNTLYIAADTAVYRVTLTEDSVASAPELVLSLGMYVRDVNIDDEGHLLVTVRTNSSSAPGYVERYDISSNLPKQRSDADWSQDFQTGMPIGIVVNSGLDPQSADDDTVYVSMRAMTGDDNETIGIWELTNITGFVAPEHIVQPTLYPGSGGGNINASADLTIDYAGNIILFENGNEELFMISPPHNADTYTVWTRSADTINILPVVSVRENVSLPKEFSVHQNYPNPFNPSTTIGFTLPVNGKVSVVVYDILGNEISRLFNGSVDAGYHAVVWNAVNNVGRAISSGMYFYRVSASLSDGRTYTSTNRMMLVK